MADQQPPAYLALDLWQAMGFEPNEFTAFFERNGWANAWAILLGSVRATYAPRHDLDVTAAELIDDMEDASNPAATTCEFDRELFARARDFILDTVIENQRLNTVLVHRTAQLDRPREAGQLMAEAMCANCGLPIQRRDGTGIWIHDESGRAVCAWAEPESQPSER